MLRAQVAELRALAGKFARSQTTLQEVETALAKIRRTVLKTVPDPARVAYTALLGRISKLIARTIPPRAKVAVIAKGCEQLLKATHRQARHFPCNGAGVYLGYHPACSQAAIAQLEAARAEGVRYLLVPETSTWWLNTYSEFRQHLEQHYRLAAQEDKTGTLYYLGKKVTKRIASLPDQLKQLFAEFQIRCQRDPAILDCHSGLKLAQIFPQLAVFSPANPAGPLPYLDHSVDIVVVNNSDVSILKEAHRVASAAVVTSRSNGSVKVEWQPDSPINELPTASLIIPVHNGWALTDACLESLLKTLPADFRGEIIVSDDGSTDATAASLVRWMRRNARIKVIRQRKNSGFVDACNRGARKATGEYLVFLNNDLVLLPGWFTPLVNTFKRFPQAGVVGGKLIMPDGTLQEAGGGVFRNGSAYHFGRGDTDLNAPLYNFVREVDYCSGALFATPRELFQKLSGFDSRFRPGYYEDTDYCFRARATGKKVFYQPESVAIHREGGTAGNDPEAGMKRHLGINAKKFYARWRKALRKHPVRPKDIGRSRLKLVFSGRVSRRALVVSYCIPRHDRNSGDRRITDTIEFLLTGGWTVTFVSPSHPDESLYQRELQQLGVAMLDGRTLRMDELLAAVEFDVAVMAFWSEAEKYLATIRRVSPNTRVIVDSVDLHFLRNARGIFTGKSNRLTPELDKAFGNDVVRELNTYAAADAVLTVSAKEAAWISDLTAQPQLAEVLPDSETPRVSPMAAEDRNGLVFIGSFRHSPNADAVRWLCQEVLPLVPAKLLARHPVHIIGDAMTDEVRQLGWHLPAVRMIGWVPSVTPYLEKARASLIPLRYGAGTKRKLLQSLMTGTPAVTTSIGAEGFQLRDGQHALIADDAKGFAAAITRLLRADDLWQQLAASGRSHIEGLHGRHKAQQRLYDILARVLATPPKRLLTAADQPARLDGAEYQKLCTRIRRLVESKIPQGAHVLVVSRGDTGLLKLNQRTSGHFPQTERGVYAGHHPANSTDAIAHLEELRTRGAEFLLLPKTAFWWLDHYCEFKKHLDNFYPVVLRREDACIIYSLRQTAKNRGSSARVTLGDNGIPVEGERPGNSHNARLIAFYLPQFYPTHENDAWWGKGFTEWANVTRARPLFDGHHQPHLPGSLGFYDLRVPEVRKAQADLAQKHGIEAFCYWHYWFHGKRLLERPFDEVLQSSQPNFPFCLSWANETWSRRWHGSGGENEVLQAQTYSVQDDIAHARWLVKAFSDRRYLKVDGRPLFLIYRPTDLPNAKRTVQTIRTECVKSGLPEPYLVGSNSHCDMDFRKLGFDSTLDFEPQLALCPGFDKAGLKQYDYLSSRRRMESRKREFPVHPCIFVRWDNTPRRGGNGIVFTNSMPEHFQAGLTRMVRLVQPKPREQRLVFINAWNEWAEGNHLEPDTQFGDAYLLATKCALEAVRPEGTTSTAKRRGEENISMPLSEGAATSACKPAQLEALRPKILSSWQSPASRTRPTVLVLGIYFATKPNAVTDIVTELDHARRYQVTQKWIALGGEPNSGRVAEVTVAVQPEQLPKFEILNRLLKQEDLAQYDYVVSMDDDIVLPRGFLDSFLALQSRLDYSIAQPARTSNSFIDHPITEQLLGLTARQTLFVEVGPVISFHRSIYGQVFPFDLTSPMGWGYPNAWASLSLKRGFKLGIIDDTPVDHSLRAPLTHYDRKTVEQERSALFQKRKCLAIQQCYRVLDSVLREGNTFTHQKTRVPSTKAQISVIIPTRNRARLLRVALQSLMGQTIGRQAFEVIVVDDGSTDSTHRVCREYSCRLPLRYHRIRHSGIAVAKNLGIFLANAPLVLFFDDDDVADRDLLRQHILTHEVYPLENWAVLGYTTWSRDIKKNPVMEYVTDVGQLLFAYQQLEHGQMLDCFHFWGGRSSCKKSFLRHGIHDRRFFNMQDVELGYRLAKFGLRIVYNQNAKSEMFREIVFDEFCQRSVRQGRAQFLFSQVHRDPEIQKYCVLVPNARAVWQEMSPHLARKAARAKRVETLIVAGKKDKNGDVRRKELHSLYEWIFKACKIKGIVEAMAEMEKPA